MSKKQAVRKKIDFNNSTVAWFCELETARKKDDYERAAKAYRNLKRLGVVIKYKGVSQKKLIAAERALPSEKPASTIIRSKDVR